MTDADDARRLIEHLTDRPATVFGTRSGGVIALQLFLDHPVTVQAVVTYEPATMRLINDGQEWVAFFHEVYHDYRNQGPLPALAKFRQRTFAPSEVSMMNHETDPRNSPHIVADATYRLGAYVCASCCDTLGAGASQVFPTVGRKSRG